MQLKLIKIGARLARHARAITFQRSEVAIAGPVVRANLAAIRPFLATAMCVIATQTKTERMWMDRSARSTQKPKGCRRMAPVHALIRSNWRSRTVVAAIRSIERLTRMDRQPILMSTGMPLWESPLKASAPLSGRETDRIFEVPCCESRLTATIQCIYAVVPGRSIGDAVARQS
jgi:hypothetical protein